MSAPMPSEENPYASPPGSGPPPKPSVETGDIDRDSRTWALMAHLSGILAGVLTGFLLSFVGPLIVWLVKREGSAFVNDQGKEALNFQLTLLIGIGIAYAITIVSCGIAFPILLLPIIFQVVFGIIAAIKSNNGEYYRYPVNIRFF
jgi:uncharacterized Tic20 family protein